MNYADVRELAVHQGKLAASIYVLCNDRWGCINKINAMCMESAAKVRSMYPTHEGERLAKKLESLHSHIPLESHIRSVSLFVNESIAWVYPLPYVAEDKIIIADRFIFDNMIHNLGRAVRYWLLILFHGKPFLFDGCDDTILEVVHRHRLKDREELVNINDLAGRVCRTAWGVNCRYKNLQEFIGVVDRDLQHFIEVDPLPVVCCADQESLKAFREYSCYADRVLLSVPLDHLYDREDLQMQLWPLVQKSYAHLQKEMLIKLKEACQVQLCARGMVQVWRALCEGRAQFICISRNYTEQICTLSAIDSVVISSSCHDGTIKDGVDVLIELALHEGVPLCWYSDNSLQELSHVAAIVSSGDQETPVSS
jgi:hypothetical protein